MNLLTRYCVRNFFVSRFHFPKSSYSDIEFTKKPRHFINGNEGSEKNVCQQTIQNPFYCYDEING